MKTSQVQHLVFTCLDGAMIDPNPTALQEVLPAIELLRSRNIPLIATTIKTAAEILPTLEMLDYQDPFIVEDGGAIYIPNGAINVSFNYKKTVRQWKVIELGTDHAIILKKIVKLRQDHRFKVTGFSEMGTGSTPMEIQVSAEEIHSAGTREYSEPVIFEGDAEELQRLQGKIENYHLRLKEREDYFMLTGDHDEGSAVRFLIQLYREEFPEKSIVSIGLGDSRLCTPLLHAVDQPVLVRKMDGSFDEEIGKRGLKFTRDPGPAGWNQAVIALVTEDQEA